MPFPMFAIPLEEQTIPQQIKTILLQDGHLMGYVQKYMKGDGMYLACRPIANGSIVLQMHDKVKGKMPSFKPETNGQYWYLVVQALDGTGKATKEIKVLSVEVPKPGEYDYVSRGTVIITNCELKQAA